MHCSLLRSDLLRPLQLVCAGATRPLGGSAQLILCAAENELCLSSSDGVLQIRVSLPLQQLITPGILSISGRKLLDFCRMLPDDAVIVLNEQNHCLEVKSSRTRAKLITLEVNDVPAVAVFSKLGSGKISIAAFKNLLSGVSFSMANQDVRYYLNGLLLGFDGHKIAAIATDGHRLAYGQVHVESNEQGSHHVLLPRKSVLELGRFLDFVGEGTCDFEYGQKGFSLSGARAWFSTNLLAGNFPSCEGMLQTKLPQTAIVSTIELKQALLRASIICQDKPRKVKFLFSGNSLCLSASNAVQEIVEEELSCEEFIGEEVEIGFDLSYLLDVLNVLKAPKVRIQFRSLKHLVRLSECVSGAFEYIIMPMLF